MSVGENKRLRFNRKWDAHDGQKPIVNSDTRFRIVAAGRRFGKTETAAHELFEDAADTPGGLFYWVAPTYDIADTGFQALKRIIPEVFVDGSPKTSKPKQIELINGAKIEFRSTDREDGLRSQGLDGVVLDEAAMIPKRAWSAELRPSLSDKLGWMIAISTPKGANWFKDYYERGQVDPGEEDGIHDHIESWHAPTEANPHIPPSEITDAKRELPERIFDQEYRAIFLEDSGGVFKKVRDRVVAEYDYTEFGGHAPYYTGVDFARQQNFTVIITLDGSGTLVEYERLQQVPWPTIQEEIEAAYQQYPGPVALDASRDNKIVGDLDRAGVMVEPVNFSSQKTELIEDLITALETEEFRIPDIPQLVNELQAFEYDTTENGNVTYHAPEGFHDDGVDALALAQWVREADLSDGGSGTATWGGDASDAPSGHAGARAQDTAPDAGASNDDGTFTIDVR